MKQISQKQLYFIFCNFRCNDIVSEVALSFVAVVVKFPIFAAAFYKHTPSVYIEFYLFDTVDLKTLTVRYKGFLTSAILL